MSCLFGSRFDPHQALRDAQTAHRLCCRHQGKRQQGSERELLHLYQAFSEVGRVERTIFLLEYMSDPAMRQHVRAETTKVESYNNFTDWLAFGGPVLRSGDPVEPEKRIKYRDLVANAVMLHNVVDMTNALHDLQREGVCITPELVARFSPYLTEHLKRFGQYLIDMNAPPMPLDIKPLFTTRA